MMALYQYSSSGSTGVASEVSVHDLHHIMSANYRRHELGEALSVQVNPSLEEAVAQIAFY